MSDPYHNSAFCVSVPITTNASGAFSKTMAAVTGRFVQYTYEPPSTDALDANWDLDVVTANGTVLINEDNLAATAVSKAIGQILYDETGTAVTYDGTNEIYVPGRWVCNETLAVTVAQGGNVQSGTLHLYFTPA